VYLPSGKYKITSSLKLSTNTKLSGYSMSPGDSSNNGSEIQWHGADGGTAIITARPELGFDEVFQGCIEHIRVKNITATTSGYGIKFRNVQNGAYLRNVNVQGFPTRQVLAYGEQPSNPADPDYPGFVCIDNCFFIGGEIPLELVCANEQVNVVNTGIDTDAKTQIGLLVSPKAYSDGHKWHVSFDSCKVEIHGNVTGDIPGIKISTDSPITFINTHIRRTLNSNSTKPAIWYTNPNKRKLPYIEIINCTSWNLGKLFESTEAGIIMMPKTINVTEGFNFRRDTVDMVVPFCRNNLTQGMSDEYLSYTTLTPSSKNGEFIMPKRGMVTYMTSKLTEWTTAGYNNVTICKNDTVCYSLEQDWKNHIDYKDFDNENLISPAFQFQAGDKISVRINTSINFAPLNNNNIIACLYFRFY
jgi:hypothetical protein